MANPEPHYQTVPSTWNNTIINGDQIHGEGFATYRVNVLVSELRRYAIKVPDIGTAYRLIIDGKLMATVGEPGESLEATDPDYQPLIVEFSPTSRRIEIIFQVSNFHYRMGGIWLPLTMGSVEDIRRETEDRRALSFILFGAIVIIGFYNFALFTLRREDRASLYLGFFCLLLSTRLLAVGERFLTHILPGLPFEWFIRIEYLSWILALSLFAAFASSILPREFPNKAAKIIHCLVGVGTLIILLTNVQTFSHIVPPFQVITILALIGGTIAFVLAVLRRLEGSLILAFAYALLFYSVVNDILVNAGIIDTILMLDFGLLCFIFFQSLLISYRFTQSFKTIEKQKESLEAANLGLQTQEKLRRQAEDESQNLHSHIDLAQKTEKIELLSDGIANLFKGEPGSQGDYESQSQFGAIFQDLLIIGGRGGIPESGVNLNSLIESVLDSPEYGNLLKTRPSSEVTCELDAALPAIEASPEHLRRMLLNVIEYPLAKAAEGCHLNLTTRSETTMTRALFYNEVRAAEYVVIGIEDLGGGIINHDELDVLFEPKYALQTLNRSSRGLGMPLIWSVVSSHGGGIDALSEESGGTHFDIYLPVVRQS
ncbi:MAG: hypothetical protein HOC70_08930 [Gammaproteobacteria bacterium]|nr:hypothetical protein [Gammaproteobacteria bacterium]